MTEILLDHETVKLTVLLLAWGAVFLFLDWD